MKIAIGIDTSCYTTSVAAVGSEGEHIASCRKLLPVSQGACGLRQSEAVFIHIKQLPPLYHELMQIVRGWNGEIVGVGVSTTPRAQEDSYMPVFLAGTSFAQVISDSLAVKRISTSHQHGHIHAGWVGNHIPSTPYMALHISGGTMELLYVQNNTIQIVGGTLDLHAGQLIDRVGVALGYGFPAGKAVEALALSCKEEAQACLPTCMRDQDLHCHLSGVETKVQQWIQKGQYPPEQIALEIFDFLSRTICRMLLAGQKKTGTQQVLIVGGVASSTLLRSMLQTRLRKQYRSSLQLVFGKPEYSADNAVGVAKIALDTLTR